MCGSGCCRNTSSTHETIELTPMDRSEADIRADKVEKALREARRALLTISQMSTRRLADDGDYEAKRTLVRIDHILQ